MMITITPDDILANATKIRDQKAAFTQAIAEMRSIVNSMSDAFPYTPISAYAQKFESYSAQLTSFEESIESFATILDACANAWEEPDQQISLSLRDDVTGLS